MVASVFSAFHNLSKIEKSYRGSRSLHGLWSESGHVVRWGNITFSGVLGNFSVKLVGRQ